MSTTSSIAPAQDESESIRAWCQQVRDIHAEATQPVLPDDPRLVELHLAAPMWTLEQLIDFGPDDLGELYFMRVSSLPEFPAPAPEWAVAVRVVNGTYPELEMDYYGQEWTEGDFTARIVRSDTITVVDKDGFPASDLHVGTPTIETSQICTVEMTLEQAMNISIALEDVANEFARRVDVTETSPTADKPDAAALSSRDGRLMERIRDLVTATGHTSADVATAMACDVEHAERLLNGDLTFTVEHMFQTADALGIAASDFLAELQS